MSDELDAAAAGALGTRLGDRTDYGLSALDLTGDPAALQVRADVLSLRG
jgi:hypothetical protein